MSVPYEILEAMGESGCTVQQMLAVLRADRDRRFLAKLRRRMQQLVVGGQPSPVLRPAKPDSRVLVSPVEGIRMAPIKAAASNGIASSTELKPGAKLVGLRLIQHLNLETGRCDPGIPGMALALGLSVRTVRRSIAELEAVGLLQRAVNVGRGHTNAYSLDLAAMAALASPIRRKPDSGENRTQMSAKPDGRVRQNGFNKQYRSVGGESPPAQRELRLFRSLPGLREEASVSGAQRRIMDDIETAAREAPDFNVSRLTEADWSAARAAEQQRRGKGIALIRERLATGPPPAAATG